MFVRLSNNVFNMDRITGQQIKELRLAKNLTMKQLADALGVSERAVEYWEKGKRGISVATNLMLRQFFFGEQSSVKNTEGKGMPVMAGVHTTGSVTTLFKDEHNEEPLFYLDAPEIKGCDYGVRVIGDSMYPLIRNGCYVACKSINNKEYILFGEIYHIITDDYSTVKYVHPHPEKEDWVMLVPYSDSAKPTPLPKTEILKIAQVRAILQVI